MSSTQRSYDQHKVIQSHQQTVPLKELEGFHLIKAFQYYYNVLRGDLVPALPEIAVDGDYGPATVTAFTNFAKQHGAGKDYVANAVTGWLNWQFQAALIKHYNPKPVEASLPPPVDPEVLRSLVNDWLAAQLPDKLKFTGALDGVIEL